MISSFMFADLVSQRQTVLSGCCVVVLTNTAIKIILVLTQLVNYCAYLAMELRNHAKCISYK